MRSLPALANASQEGSGHRISYTLISGMPAEASYSFLKCTGLSVNTSSLEESAVDQGMNG